MCHSLGVATREWLLPNAAPASTFHPRPLNRNTGGVRKAGPGCARDVESEHPSSAKKTWDSRLKREPRSIALVGVIIDRGNLGLRHQRNWIQRFRLLRFGNRLVRSAGADQIVGIVEVRHRVAGVQLDPPNKLFLRLPPLEFVETGVRQGNM